MSSAFYLAIISFYGLGVFGRTLGYPGKDDGLDERLPESSLGLDQSSNGDSGRVNNRPLGGPDQNQTTSKTEYGRAGSKRWLIVLLIALVGGNQGISSSCRIVAVVLAMEDDDCYCAHMHAACTSPTVKSRLMRLVVRRLLFLTIDSYLF